MYSTDSDVLTAFSSDAREIYVRATFNQKYKVDGEYIKTFEITDSMSGSNDALTLGNTCASKLELEMFMPPTDGYTYTDPNTQAETKYTDFCGVASARIEPEVGVDVNGTIKYVPLGVFYVDSYESKNEFRTVKITAFDAMLKIDSVLGSNYACTLSGTTVKAIDVIKNILTRAGISTSEIESNSGTETKYVVRKFEAITYDDTGAKSASNASVGTSEPIEIPKNVSSRLGVEAWGSDSLTSIKVLYFSDAAATQLISVEKPSISESIDAGDDDSGELRVGIDASANIPTHSNTIYALICSDYEGTFDTVIDGEYDITYTIDHGEKYINEEVTIPNPGKTNISARAMLGYMAGILGCNACFDRKGRFVLKRIASNDTVTIGREEEYIDGFEKSIETPLTINYLTTGSGGDSGEDNDKIITVGSGDFGFNFSNPYIPVTIGAKLDSSSASSAKNAPVSVGSKPEYTAQNILNLYKGISFLTGSVKYRCNPAIESGDLVSVEGKEGVYHNLLVLENKISMTGGLSATLTCNISTEHSKDFVSTPNSTKLSARFNDFVQSYEDIVSILTGTEGGYVKKVMDSTDHVRALAIVESDVEVKWDEKNNKVIMANESNNTVPMWVWSKGGLSFSNDGGNTYEVAINMQGKIWANLIQGELGYYGNLTAGGWDIGKTRIEHDGVTKGDTNNRVGLQCNGAAAFYAGCNTPAGGSIASEKSSNFYVTHDGYLFSNNAKIKGDILADSGRIGAWNIDSSTERSKGLYADYIGSSAAYRVYLQPGYFDSSKNTAGQTWAISTQKGTVTNGKVGAYTGTFMVYANGEVHVESAMYFGKFGNGALYVNGNGKVGLSSSSQRYKENISDVIPEEYNPEHLYNLPVKIFNYKDECKDREIITGTQIGFIAEDVEKYYPNALMRDKEQKAESWHERIMIPAMLRLIQEQKRDIDNLNERVSKLETLIDKLIKE